MKKIKGVLIIGICVFLFLVCGRYETTSKKDGKVIEQKGFVVTVEDENGLKWKWNTEKHFSKDEKVIIYIDNKGTFKNVDDDIVKKIKKVE